MFEHVTPGVALLFFSLFLFVCVLASRLSTRLGIPALVLFIAVGMIAGSEGPGGIHFEDFKITKELGLIALGFILFSGGMDTNWKTVRPIAPHAFALSTIGVGVTAGLVGLFAHYVLGFSFLEGLLLGAIVSPTDSAAIFSVLRSRGLELKNRVAPTLEFESGANDPMAFFLTLGLTRTMVDPDFEIADLLPLLLWQMTVGTAVGFVIGKLLVWLINNIRLEYDGLYPVLTIAGVGATYSIAGAVGGNEVLAVYVGGMVLGSSIFVHKISLMQFHDGIAWLLQILVFIVLGLLVFPSQLIPVTAVGFLLAGFLILIARPAAIFLSLIFAKMSLRKKAFLSWAGLRGAFPIILGTVPVLAGVEKGHLIFNLVFFVVFTSVLVQGVTLRSMARLTGVLSKRDLHEDLTPAHHSELLELELSKLSPATDKQVVDLDLPQTVLLVLLKRGSEHYIPRGGTILRAGDKLLVATRREDRQELRLRLEGAGA